VLPASAVERSGASGSLAGGADGYRPEAIVDAALTVACAANPQVLVTITAGSRGSWSWDGARLAHRPVVPADAVCTAGAGDAHLAGVLAGLARGLLLPDAHTLGSLAAAFSVTSPHTIHPDLNLASLRRFAAEAGIAIPTRS
jgi:ribokinase